MFTRQHILATLQQTLQPLETVYAAFEGGSAAFGWVDEWSDIDLQIIVADDAVADIARRVEAVLDDLGGVILRYEVPMPSWHGHFQVFYQFKDASPFLLLDLVLMQVSNPVKFLEPEIHGQRVVLFDKDSYTVVPPLDTAQWQHKLEERLKTLRVTFDMFRTLTLKEIYRGNDLEALAFYHGFTLRPLVEALRIKHDPYRYNFYLRHVYHDLPRPVIDALHPLFFVSDVEDLAAKRLQAETWFKELTA